MGIALQYVNIARDIDVDAGIGRVYVPTSWLQEVGSTPLDVLDHSRLEESQSDEHVDGDDVMESLRGRLLDKAFEMYREARPALADLPVEARAPIRVAVESYM